MSRFRAVLVEHGYASLELEREVINAAGGELIDADALPLAEALRLCEDADAVMVRRIQVTAELIRRFRRCRILLRYGVGTDNVDVHAATEANMIVGHVPSYCLDEVSTHALALLLACVRNVVTTHAAVQRGAWDVNRTTPLWRMAGRTLGIVGFGQIGQALAAKLASWGMTLLAADPFVDPDRAGKLGVRLLPLEEVLRASDYVSLHAPLLPETHHLINARSLAWMKPGAILVNTARGGLVDGTAVRAALDQGRLAWAALDVFEEEPLPVDSPMRQHPRILTSDHVAWYSEESQRQLQRTAAEEVARVCTGGLPRSLANPEVIRRLGRWDEWTPGETVRWQLRRLERLGAS
jgi:D-3-phosphoglycerate dehydrogenase